MGRRVVNLNLQLLKKYLTLDVDSGVFTWAIDRQGHAKAGDKAGSVSKSTGYVYIGILGKTYAAHRLVWMWLNGNFPNVEVDHINGDRTDNRPANLRQASVAQNRQNQRSAHKDSACGLLGVRRNGKRFSAGIQTGGKWKYLGTFDTPELAHEAYVQAKRELHPYGVL